MKKIKINIGFITKVNYKIHYKNLEYYMQLGIKADKVHKILTFDERDFLKEYIDNLFE